jgi:hypothetical protein
MVHAMTSAYREAGRASDRFVLARDAEVTSAISAG